MPLCTQVQEVEASNDKAIQDALEELSGIIFFLSHMIPHGWLNVIFELYFSRAIDHFLSLSPLKSIENAYAPIDTQRGYAALLDDALMLVFHFIYKDKNWENDVVRF